MASFRQHVAISTALGIGYGAAAYYGLGMDWAPCVIAGGLASLAGMLPDLDSPSGQPVREVMGFAAAMIPVLLLKRWGIAVDLLHSAAGTASVRLSHETLVVVLAGCYLAVRFCGAWLLDLLTVHRGMFHSIPAAMIVALIAYLLCDAPTQLIRLFLAGGSLLGFLSHLVMDELWSVRLSVTGLGLKKSAGSAFKLFSNSLPATLTTYALLLALSYLAVEDVSVRQAINRFPNHPAVPKVAWEWVDRLIR